jgi:hypothetical protein
LLTALLLYPSAAKDMNKNAVVYCMKYKVTLFESKEGFSVRVLALPGCHSQGATEQEALENVQNAIWLCVTNTRGF